MSIFHVSRPFSMSIFHVLPGLFNRVDIEQVRFSYAQTKSTKQQIEPSLTVDNDNVCKGQKHAHESEMQQPFGLFSMTFHDFPGLENLNFKFHDFQGTSTHPDKQKQMCTDVSLWS